eukprot:TRINITY_DN7306_c0_g1_i15.p1 TRINITY_DN7306_c0_g1~~TRINITY_DN7306_c0_g1_i15.p1  ORF type:complete len:322 (+),score=43.95 TRINITY_DN7306_c0_g1_i15:101-967(+)
MDDVLTHETQDSKTVKWDQPLLDYSQLTTNTQHLERGLSCERQKSDILSPSPTITTSLHLGTSRISPSPSTTTLTTLSPPNNPVAISISPSTNIQPATSPMSMTTVFSSIRMSGTTLFPRTLSPRRILPTLAPLSPRSFSLTPTPAPAPTPTPTPTPTSTLTLTPTSTPIPTPTMDQLVEEFTNAAWIGDTERVVQMLSDNPSEKLVNGLNSRGQCALYAAARQGHHDIILELLKYPKLDVDKACGDHKGTALHGKAPSLHLSIPHLGFATPAHLYFPSTPTSPSPQF